MFTEIERALLFIHIFSGSLALLCALLALVFKKGSSRHTLSGRLYVTGMLGVFFTAVPLSIMLRDSFLFVIAFFSIYMVLAGWRFARNQTGQVSWVDYLRLICLLILIVMMVGYSVWLFIRHDISLAIVMTVFSTITCGLARRDFTSLRTPVRGKQRIANHLTFMLGGTIAVVTAVLVVNAPIPVLLKWLLPTWVIVPLIVRWNIRVLSGKKKAV